MAARVGTAAVALPILASIVWAGGPWFGTLVIATALVAAYETTRLLRPRHILATVRLITLLGTLALIIAVYIVSIGAFNSSLVGAVLVGTFIQLFGTSWALTRSVDSAARQTAFGMGTILYTAGLLSYALLLREANDGWEWVCLTLGVVFASDTFALFVGRYAGRTKMAPSISPGKTWEGAAGGLAASIAAGVALGYALGLDVPAWQIAVIAACASVAGQAGDLAESKLKRIVAVKDSGRVLPGHGGLLDRIDSIVAALPVMYYSVIWWIQ